MNHLINIFSFGIIFIFLYLINFILIKYKKLIHSSHKEKHKKFGLDKIPLSGGLFFFFVFSYLNLDQYFINNFYIIGVFCYLFFGLLVDLDFDINPKIRFLLQIFLTIIFVFIFKLTIYKTNLSFLDFLLGNNIFNILFTSLCILIILNGLNFMDGVNNNVVGFCLLIIFSIIVIETKNSSIENLYYFKILLYSLIVFYFFNSFNKNYLGDSGIYVLAISISLIVILFVNNSQYVSPLLAVNFLWYPALETLFSIIRKLNDKKNPFKPDTKHLHTLFLKFLGSRNIKMKNTMSGLFINFSLIPNFIISMFYYSNSKILILTTLIYIIAYVLIYYRLNNILKNNLID